MKSKESGMTSSGPTPAEIEEAAREWLLTMGWPEPDVSWKWEYYKQEARALIALRAKDKTRIEELEAGDCLLRQTLSDVASVLDECGPPWLASLARSALADTTEKT